MVKWAVKILSVLLNPFAWCSGPSESHTNSPQEINKCTWIWFIADLEFLLFLLKNSVICNSRPCTKSWEFMSAIMQWKFLFRSITSFYKLFSTKQGLLHWNFPQNLKQQWFNQIEAPYLCLSTSKDMCTMCSLLSFQQFDRSSML